MKNNGTLIVSLDFELYWGMTDCVALEDYCQNILGGREAIPRLLKLFEKHNIHATWATVGFMFANSKSELAKYFPDLKPSYTNPKLSPYPMMDTVGQTEDDAPHFFAPSLIELISKTKGQEIASHTFSHYYCRENGQTSDQFCADMQSALKIAEDKGYSLKSVVLPRNQCTPECVKALSKLGFENYRDEENDWIHKYVKFRPLMRILRLMDVYIPLTGRGGYIPKTEDGILNLIGSRMFKPIFNPLAFLERLKIHRIKSQMKHAAKHNLVFHLWWHPHNIGVKTDKHLCQLSEIFNYYDKLKQKYNMQSLNMHEASAMYKD